MAVKQEPKEDHDDSTKVDEEDLTDRIQTPSPLKQAPRQVPPGVNDFDKENWNEPFSVANYAMDIFEYLKGREVSYIVFFYLVHFTNP